jgi:hypothetical protein
MHFQCKPYIWNINLAPTCFGAAGARSSRSPKYPDKIVCMRTLYIHLFGTYDVAYARFH